MKKIISLILVLSLILALCGCGTNSNKVTLRVYNWGEFIDMELLDKFEDETGIKVLYDVYTDNESLYAKIKNSGDDSDIAKTPVVFCAVSAVIALIA